MHRGYTIIGVISLILCVVRNEIKVKVLEASPLARDLGANQPSRRVNPLEGYYSTFMLSVSDTHFV